MVNRPLSDKWDCENFIARTIMMGTPTDCSKVHQEKSSQTGLRGTISTIGDEAGAYKEQFKYCAALCRCVLGDYFDNGHRTLLISSAVEIKYIEAGSQRTVAPESILRTSEDSLLLIIILILSWNTPLIRFVLSTLIRY